jgi:hypothetical protein
MNARLLPAGFLLCGLTLLGAAGFCYFIPSDGLGVTIDEPDRAFPTYAAGQTLDVPFRIHNPTGHTVRIVGLGVC